MTTTTDTIWRMEILNERRARWTAGPWDDEPDMVQWTDEPTGLRCVVRRGLLGHLCGYVSVPWPMPYAPALGEAVYPDEDVYDVYGGITFADYDRELGEGFWFGFDCAHAGDLVPELEWWREQSGAPIHPIQLFADDPYRPTYKDVPFVISECTRLAAQIKVLDG